MFKRFSPDGRFLFSFTRDSRGIQLHRFCWPDWMSNEMSFFDQEHKAQQDQQQQEQKQRHKRRQQNDLNSNIPKKLKYSDSIPGHASSSSRVQLEAQSQVEHRETVQQNNAYSSLQSKLFSKCFTPVFDLT
eukprot:Pgem_evm1s4676